MTDLIFIPKAAFSVTPEHRGELPGAVMMLYKLWESVAAGSWADWLWCGLCRHKYNRHACRENALRLQESAGCLDESWIQTFLRISIKLDIFNFILLCRVSFFSLLLSKCFVTKEHDWIFAFRNSLQPSHELHVRKQLSRSACKRFCVDLIPWASWFCLWCARKIYGKLEVLVLTYSCWCENRTVIKVNRLLEQIYHLKLGRYRFLPFYNWHCLEL